MSFTVQKNLCSHLEGTYMVFGYNKMYGEAKNLKWFFENHLNSCLLNGRNQNKLLYSV